MTDKDYKRNMDALYQQLVDLPDHDNKTKRVTADQLNGMNADLALGRLEIDALELDKDKVHSMMKKIENLSFDEMQTTLNLEKPYDGSISKDFWSLYAKQNRCHLLIQQYTLLCRLRNNDPEAWDKINELYYDD